MESVRPWLMVTSGILSAVDPIDEGVRDAHAERVHRRGRRAVQPALQALVALDTALDDVLGLALRPGELDAIDPAVAQVDELHVVDEAAEEAAAARGVGADAIALEREILLVPRFAPRPPGAGRWPSWRSRRALRVGARTARGREQRRAENGREWKRVRPRIMDEPPGRAGARVRNAFRCVETMNQVVARQAGGGAATEAHPAMAKRRAMPAGCFDQEQDDERAEDASSRGSGADPGRPNRRRRTRAERSRSDREEDDERRAQERARRRCRAPRG